jgi:hypothetical protein
MATSITRYEGYLDHEIDGHLDHEIDGLPGSKIKRSDHHITTSEDHKIQAS